MDTAYFLFDLNNHLGAVDAAYVAEVLALPELILIPEAPLGIAGVLDLRGEILPVMDLRPIDQDALQQFRLTDHILVLKHTQVTVGLIVDGVHGFQDLPAFEETEILSTPLEWKSPHAIHLFTQAQVNGEASLMLKPPDQWSILYEIQQFILATTFLVGDMHSGSLQNTFRQAILPEAASTFQQRARDLNQRSDASSTVEETRSLVVIELQGELFGIESEAVREFMPLRQVTPIPCCPPHIIGSVNLRGEIVTIVDIRTQLSLPAETFSKTLKVVIIEIDNLIVGVTVDSIREATFAFKREDIQTVTNTAFSFRPDYVQGEVLYDEEGVRILDISRLLLSDALVVNDLQTP